MTAAYRRRRALELRLQGVPQNEIARELGVTQSMVSKYTSAHITRKQSYAAQRAVRVQKPCRACGETLPMAAFHRDASQLDGRAGWCKACRCLASRERHHTLAAASTATRGYARVVLADPCVYCGGPADTLDHIEPLSAGGDHDWTNLAGACRPCNSRKERRPLLTFLLTGKVLP